MPSTWHQCIWVEWIPRCERFKSLNNSRFQWNPNKIRMLPVTIPIKTRINKISQANSSVQRENAASPYEHFFGTNTQNKISCQKIHVIPNWHMSNRNKQGRTTIVTQIRGRGTCGILVVIHCMFSLCVIIFRWDLNPMVHALDNSNSSWSNWMLFASLEMKTRVIKSLCCTSKLSTSVEWPPSSVCLLFLPLLF